MGSKPPNIFAGGWTPQKAAKLNQTQLPEKTRCQNCHKIKTINNFSNKQLMTLRHRIAGPNGHKAKSAIAEIITCLKGLDGFSKAQRKDPDEARCILCLHQQSEEGWAHAEPNHEDSEDDDSDDSTTTNPYTSVSYRTDPQVTAASTALKAVNLSEHDKTYGEQAQAKASTTETHSDLLGSYSDDGFTPVTSSKGKGKAKAQGDEWQSFASKSSDQKPVGSRARFAKIPRGQDRKVVPDNVKKQLKVMATTRTVDNKWESSDDDDYRM
ncbi:MAG: hypothetical protein L6R37_005944 [Teloschistes peruensis]|nr:MAG: hypothetical protein L6R37_005944 [Teloschistes peruensis]